MTNDLRSTVLVQWNEKRTTIKVLFSAFLNHNSLTLKLETSFIKVLSFWYFCSKNSKMMIILLFSLEVHSVWDGVPVCAVCHLRSHHPLEGRANHSAAHRQAPHLLDRISGAPVPRVVRTALRETD